MTSLQHETPTHAPAEPRRDALVSIPLSGGGAIALFSESFAGRPPSLRIEKSYAQGSDRPSRSFAVSPRFATEFTSAVLAWAERVERAKEGQ